MIGVEGGGAFIKIPGGQQPVIFYPVTFPAFDQRHLCMYLQSGYAIDNIYPGGFHPFGPFDIIGFIKTCL